ncbi:MAG: DUF1553 domain-containing protein [Planctomycetota bacterium]|nr:DUF1553 domain-containing protein [Planctomycetota bacterium]
MPALASLLALTGAFGEAPDFARDVKPIFAAHCISCHGPVKEKGGVRFDSAAGARKAIVAGDPARSSLYERITSLDPDERMPKKADALSAAQIETLRAWIEAGASWPESAQPVPTHSTHWAYQPIVRPTPPKLASESGVRSPIDRFVRAKLEAAGIAPSLEADIPTLARRVALDLTGLPPTPQDLDALLADVRPDAYERYVDRLLSTHAYAERRAQTWLDLARYADTNGYEKDERRIAWRWRDWVIEAYQRNMPFDEFTVDQLAGDLLPDATLDDRIATGFHRNTLTNQEGGTDPEEFRVAAVVDRVNTTASVWLGTTMACAQCHAHKFDPFTHEDYYRFLAFFDSTEDVGNSLEPQVPAPTAAQERELERLTAEVARAEAAWIAPDPELDANEASWLSSAGPALLREPEWRVLAPQAVSAKSGSVLTKLDDGSVLASGEQPDTETYTLEGDLESIAIQLRVEALADPTLPEDGPGRAGHGNFVLSDVAVEVQSGEEWKRMPLAHAEADHEQMRGGTFLAAYTIDADKGTGWAIWREDDTCLPQTLVIALGDWLSPGRIRVQLAFESPYAKHTLGRFRVSFAEDPDRAQLVGISPAEREALLSMAEMRTPEQQDLAHRAFRSRGSKAGRERAEQLAAARTALDAYRAGLPTALVLRELPVKRETHVLEKGSFLSKGERVYADTPSVLPPMPKGAPHDRLGLARWLVSAENPLTARVQVNRVWGELFGTPLVTTVDDFGTRGERPTHPEVLDWLAAEFVESGWDVRALYRTIVTSATYRQSSHLSAELLEKDRGNALLARQSRPRLEVETLRDQALAIAGLLDATVGGPSVMPPQPDGVWAPVYSGDNWMTATNADRYRRGLYTFWRRGAHYLTFALFDATSRELSCTRRARTNSPLQALALLGDRAFVECAAGLAQQMVRGGGDDPARIAHGFRIATLRSPAAGELQLLGQLLARERARYTADPASAQALVEHVDAALREGSSMDPVELAAWTSVAQALLNLDEVVTRN